jgi:hypothetical protein
MAMAAAASNATRKYQESMRSDKLPKDVNTIVASLPDRKEWIANHGLQMLMLNGYGVLTCENTQILLL